MWLTPIYSISFLINKLCKYSGQWLALLSHVPADSCGSAPCTFGLRERNTLSKSSGATQASSSSRKNGSGVRLVDVSGGWIVLAAEHLPPPRNGQLPVICRSRPHAVLFNGGDDASPTRYLLRSVCASGAISTLRLKLQQWWCAHKMNNVNIDRDNNLIYEQDKNHCKYHVHTSSHHGTSYLTFMVQLCKYCWFIPTYNVSCLSGLTVIWRTYFSIWSAFSR